MTQARSTREEILVHLRHRPHTIAELASALGITRNAVLLPLTDLERKGLVRRQSAERTGRAGKPAQMYAIAPQTFEQTSAAYQAIAPHLLVQIGTAEASTMTRAMKAVGRSMHAEVSASLSGRDPIGLEPALDFLARHGAEIEVQQSGGDAVVLSHSCPIGRLVRADRHICRAIGSFLGEASGARATSECIYADKLTCRFRLKDTAAPRKGAGRAP